MGVLLVLILCAQDPQGDYLHLLDRIQADSDWARHPVSRQDAEGDLDELERTLQREHTYLGRREVDLRQALAAVRRTVKDGTTRGVLTIQIQKVLSLLGDVHTRVGDLEEALPEGYLPFLVAEVDGRIAAFREDRSGPVEEGHPFVGSIDGLDVESWIRAAEEIVPRGSPQATREESVRGLRRIQYLRHELELSRRETVQVVFTSADGESVRNVEMDLADTMPDYGEWPRHGREVLPGDIGYIRLPEMSERSSHIEEIGRILDRYRETRGLIIDVRGVRGGSRKAIPALLGQFLSPGDLPRVINVAALRGSDEGLLLHPRDWEGWSEAERAAVEAVAESFRPEWAPGEEIGPWLYAVVSGDGSVHDRPISILIDERCRGPVEILIGALKGRPRITLVGTPTAGGSGHPRAHTLPRSGIGLWISSMVSYRPDGRLFDGRGIRPDILARPTLRDLLGERDSVIEAGLRKMR
jgi:hypothetical protein